MLMSYHEELNCAVDLNVFAMDYEKYDDSQLNFEEENDEQDEQNKQTEQEEPYTAY